MTGVLDLEKVGVSFGAALNREDWGIDGTHRCDVGVLHRIAFQEPAPLWWTAHSNGLNVHRKARHKAQGLNLSNRFMVYV